VRAKVVADPLRPGSPELMGTTGLPIPVLPVKVSSTSPSSDGPKSSPRKSPGESPILLNSSSDPGVGIVLLLLSAIRKMLRGGGVRGRPEILLYGESDRVVGLRDHTDGAVQLQHGSLIAYILCIDLPRRPTWMLIV
jgi:hypothetical protein